MCKRLPQTQPGKSVCFPFSLKKRQLFAGLWSQIKRAPKAKKVRKTFEVAGPARADALPLDERARQLFAYFKNYNYEVMETGETIRFAGTYKASRGQAAALIFYVFCGRPLLISLSNFEG